jgi:hypothetical protein
MRQHGLLIAALFGIGLLVISANLESPRWWLILPGWIIVASCIALLFISASDSSPYKQGFVLPALAFICYFGLWESGFRGLLNLLFQPSSKHLYNFLTNRPFLVLTIMYFAAVCVFYSKELQDRQDRLDDYKKLHERNLKELDRWERLASDDKD